MQGRVFPVTPKASPGGNATMRPLCAARRAMRVGGG